MRPGDGAERRVLHRSPRIATSRSRNVSLIGLELLRPFHGLTPKSKNSARHTKNIRGGA